MKPNLISKTESPNIFIKSFLGLAILIWTVTACGNNAAKTSQIQPEYLQSTPNPEQFQNQIAPYSGYNPPYIAPLVNSVPVTPMGLTPMTVPMFFPMFQESPCCAVMCRTCVSHRTTVVTHHDWDSDDTHSNTSHHSDDSNPTVNDRDQLPPSITPVTPPPAPVTDSNPPADPTQTAAVDTKPNDDVQQVVDTVDQTPPPPQPVVSDENPDQITVIPDTAPVNDARDAAIDASNQADVKFSTQNLYFAWNKADLEETLRAPPAGAAGGETSTFKQVLKTARLFAKVQDKIKTITVVGQADKSGGEAYNRKLSVKRAVRVASIMTDPDAYTGLESLVKPLAPRKVFVNGLGEPDTSSCGTEEKCPQDRRVWFFIDLLDELDPTEKNDLMKKLNDSMVSIWGTEITTVPNPPAKRTRTRSRRR